VRDIYEESRAWVSLSACPACGTDHVEKEFKLGDDGVYRGRCHRERATLILNKETGVVSVKTED